MAGFDQSRILNPTDELGFLACGICLAVLNTPVITPCCREAFCKICITRWVLAKHNCPFDRQPLSQRRLTPAPKLVVSLLNRLQIQCENHEKGCNAELTVERVADHQKDCPFRKCGVCGFS